MIERFCDWLAATAVSQTFQVTSWFVPTVQTVHILCIAVVVTSVAILSCRFLGLIWRAQPLATLMASFMPGVWVALGVLLLTGVLLTITEPSRELLNAAFQAKMVMVAAMALILGGMQRGLRKDPDFWAVSPFKRGAARALGATALLLVVNIVIAGRWIAYL